MKWAQEHATIKFELPNLPHLTEEQVVLYKEQVREREEGLETARREDRRAMANEDRARKEMERIKRNKLKRSAAVLEEGPGSQESIPDTLEAEVRPVAAEVETDVKVQVHAEELDSRHEDEGNRDSLRRKRGLNSFTSEDDDSNEEL